MNMVISLRCSTCTACIMYSGDAKVLLTQAPIYATAK